MPPENANFVGVLILVLEADFARPVLRTIFTDDEFKLKVGFLHHHPFYRLPDVRLVIVGDHVDRNHRIPAKLLSI